YPYSIDSLLIYYFFFQAEDGIRDFHVTGVQTCALPISPDRRGRSPRRSPRPSGRSPPLRRVRCRSHRPLHLLRAARLFAATACRSEERRVGKEGRSRSSPHHYNKKLVRIMTPLMDERFC